MRSSAQLTASPDYHSPINTAVMLLKPNRSIFEEGCRVLGRKRFDRIRGFEFSGPPREVMAHLANTTDINFQHVERTRMVAHNDWNFIGGHACQGLFVYLFLVNDHASQSRLSYPKGLVYRRQHPDFGLMRVHHFRAGSKPWGASARCPEYFGFLEEVEKSSNGVDAGLEDDGAARRQDYCWRMLRRKRDCLAPKLSKEACMACRRLHLSSSCGNVRQLCDGTKVLVF